jgi:hypothetical protein
MRCVAYLSVDKVLAVKLLLSGARVPGEEDTSTRRVAHVAEHHALHVDSRAPQPGDLVDGSVLVCSRTVPGVEHSAHRELKLLLRVYKTRITWIIWMRRNRALVSKHRYGWHERGWNETVPEGNGSPLTSMYASLYWPTSSLRSLAVRSVSFFTPLASFMCSSFSSNRSWGMSMTW